MCKYVFHRNNIRRKVVYITKVFCFHWNVKKTHIQLHHDFVVCSMPPLLWRQLGLFRLEIQRFLFLSILIVLKNIIIFIVLFISLIKLFLIIKFLLFFTELLILIVEWFSIVMKFGVLFNKRLSSIVERILFFRYFMELCALFLKFDFWLVCY